MSGNAGRAKHFPLWLIVGLSAAPFVLATLIYFFWKPTESKTAGVLLTPIQQMPEATLTTLDDKPVPTQSLRGKWLLLTLSTGPCAQACRDTLYRMRQVRTAQGKEMDRVDRVWIVTQPNHAQGTPQDLTQGVTRLSDSGRMAPFLPVSNAGLNGAIYLVDPQGNLVMRYDPSVDPVKMIREVAKILKLNNGLG